ncbi:MAG: ATP-dependent helicase [Fibrobacterales bacterium]
MKNLDHLISQCNTPQKEAVLFDHAHGPLLILAGAGTGKTTVLTLRIAHLCTAGVNPSTIVALTFTQKAAIEMRERLEPLIAPLITPALKGGVLNRVELPTAATFHSFAYSLLKDTINGTPNYQRVGFSAIPRVAEQEELRRALQNGESLQSASLKTDSGDEREKVIENPFCLEQPDRSSARILTEWCRLNNALPFESMISLTRVLLMDTEVQRWYHRRYSHILVDEYQDVNMNQYLLSRQLIGNRQTLFVVGDDDQAIYGFRGADVRNILAFKSDYPRAHIIKLEHNYRSTQPIITLANRIFADKSPEFRKELLVGSQRDTSLFRASKPVCRIDLPSGIAELLWIQRTITHLREGHGISYSDCAILARLNSQVSYYTEGLKYLNVPVKESKEIEDDAVVIQTVHASKGLQYPVVFYGGVSNDLTPLKNSAEESDSDEDEERRVFYVGVTRAESLLYLLHTSKRVFNNRARKFTPSLFLKYLFESLHQKIQRKVHYALSASSTASTRL